MEWKFFYSIQDKKARMFLDPFVGVNDVIAMRDFQMHCMKGDSPLSLFAEDYALVCLGRFNVADGTIEMWPDGPAVICQASAFKKERE